MKHEKAWWTDGIGETHEGWVVGSRDNYLQGINHDLSKSILPGYINIDGVWVHPDRVEWGEKHGPVLPHLDGGDILSMEGG